MPSMVDEAKLNNKLAEWAGFRPLPQKGWEGEYAPPEGVKVVWTVFKPRFTQSLDQCFKWLVPKLEPLGYELEISNDAQMLGWRVCLRNQHSESSIASPYQDFSEPNGAALALCLVIEKIIDWESADAIH